MIDQKQLRRVVVGVDPSEGARLALEWAVAVALRFEAELVLVHGRGLLEAATAGGDGPPEWLESLTDTVSAELALSMRVVDGPPPEALLRAATDVGAELIVVGKRGAGSPYELTMGSTSREVASRAVVPVLVVPAA